MAAFNEFLRQQARDLPKLPVPPLEQTMQKYLRSTKPFLTEAEYIASEKLIKEVLAPGSIGEKLQELLKKRAQTNINWLSDWWLNVVYLDCRLPLPVFSNTCMVFPFQEFNSDNDKFFSFAAALVASMMDFKALLEANKIPPEKMGPYVLDMSQYKRIYSTCRVPGEQRDQVCITDPPAKHILVMHNNHMFAVPVHGERGEPLNQKQLQLQLESVVYQSPTKSIHPLAIMTSEKRSNWARTRQSLIQASPENKKLMKVLESSLFCLCLDEALDEKHLRDHHLRLNAAAARIMHGNGCNDHAANRWFDIVAQFIVTKSGEVGLNCEHSPGEAHPIVTNHMEIYWETKRGSKDPVPPAGIFAPPQQLKFTMPSDVIQAIEKAAVHSEALASSLEMNCFTFSDYGKEFIRSLKIGSVDSYIQMAIQLTFYRMYNEPSAQYESASTRGFVHGRTETIRSCSAESVNFARAMVNPSSSDKEKFAALQKAMDAHKDYVISALSGEGVDRHLLGLRLIAAENGLEMPALFSDAGFIRSSNMRLSTSQVPVISPSHVFFGPLVADGFGCCYNPRANAIFFGITAYNDCPITSATAFCESLGQSLNLMKKIALSHVHLQDKL